MTVGRIPNIEGGIQPTLLTTTGDIMYASSANNPARLGIGSSAQVLTVASGVPSWATPASGGMTLISTTSLSGATVTLSSIPQTYVSLYLVMFGLTNATGNGFNRIAPNNVTNLTDKTGVFNSAVNQRTNDYLELGDGGATLRTSTNNVYVITVDNYTSSTNYKTGELYGSDVSSASSTNRFQFAYVFRSNTALTSMVISNSGGNLSTGTALLYGVK